MAARAGAGRLSFIATPERKMPIVSAVKKSPGGAPYVRAESHGQVSLADAHALMDPLRPGGEHHEFGLMAVVAAGSEFTPEARKVFGMSDPERNAKNVPTAMVVASAPMHVMMGFVFKMAGATDRTRVFATEAEANTWMFAKLDA